MKSREQTAIKAQCQQALRQAGKSYPRTCAACKLGPCKFTAIPPPAQGSIDAEERGARLTIGEAFAQVGGWFNGGELGYPSFGSADALRVYTIKMQRDAVLADRAARQSAAPGDLVGKIQAALDIIAEQKSMQRDDYITVSNTLHNCRDAVLGRGHYGEYRAAPAPSEPVPQGVPEVLQLREVVRASVSDLVRLHAAFGFPEDQITDVDDMIAALKAAPTATSGGEVVGKDGALLAQAIEACDGCMDETQVEPEDAAAWKMVRAALLAPPPLPGSRITPEMLDQLIPKSSGS